MAYDTVCLHLFGVAVSLMHAGQPLLFQGSHRKRERMASHRHHPYTAIGVMHFT